MMQLVQIKLLASCSTMTLSGIDAFVHVTTNAIVYFQGSLKACNIP